MYPNDDNPDQTAGSAASPALETVAQIEKLWQRDRQARAATVRELRRAGDVRAVEPLCAALREDEDTSVRFAAAWALWQFADGRAFEPLCAALTDSVRDVKNGEGYSERSGEISRRHRTFGGALLLTNCASSLLSLCH